MDSDSVKSEDELSDTEDKHDASQRQCVLENGFVNGTSQIKQEGDFIGETPVTTENVFSLASEADIVDAHHSFTYLRHSLHSLTVSDAKVNKNGESLYGSTKFSYGGWPNVLQYDSRQAAAANSMKPGTSASLPSYSQGGKSAEIPPGETRIILQNEFQIDPWSNCRDISCS